MILTVIYIAAIMLIEILYEAKHGDKYHTWSVLANYFICIFLAKDLGVSVWVASLLFAGVRVWFDPVIGLRLKKGIYYLGNRKHDIDRLNMWQIIKAGFVDQDRSLVDMVLQKLNINKYGLMGIRVLATLAFACAAICINQEIIT